jgi:hypothetical protein
LAFFADPRGESRRLIPVRVGPCVNPRLFRQLLYIDFVGKDEDERRRRLLDHVRGGRFNRSESSPAPSSVAPQISVGKLPSGNSTLIGRDDILDQLDRAWIDPAIRLVFIVAFHAKISEWSACKRSLFRFDPVL